MTPTQTQHFVEIRERNKIVWCVAKRHCCSFIPRSDGGLNGEFELTEELETTMLDYHQNGYVRVQDFIAASRYVSDAIHDHRQRLGVNRGN